MDVETSTLAAPDAVVAPVVDTGRSSLARRVTGIATIVLLPVLLAMAWFYAPEDAAQGAAQRIFYIHVPSAWIGFLAFFVVFVGSLGVLFTGKRRYDDVAAASAEIGTLFTTAVLITGPLWGRPVWGVYWTWDPRLTSFMMLWLIYVSYLVLRGYVPDPARRARFSAVLGIVGFLDVPIVYMSVRWWRSEHPAQYVFSKGGLPSEAVTTLMVGLATFTCFYVWLLLTRLRTARLQEAAENEEVIQ